MEIYLEDLEDFFRRESDEQLMKSILKNTKRYSQLFFEVSSRLLPERLKQYSIEEEYQHLDLILQNQRLENLRLVHSDPNPSNQLPPQLRSTFETYILSGPNHKKKLTPLRQLKSDKIGSLVSVKCIVVRTSDVKPMMQVASFACDSCGFEVY